MRPFEETISVVVPIALAIVGTVILEDPEGRRFLFPAKLLKLIEVPPRGDH